MHNVIYSEVSERILKSTQTCSHCFALTCPRGRKGLGVSAWQCVKCGKLHNRNENSADNHRLAYKEALLNQRLESKGIKLPNDLSANKLDKVEPCPEKELKNKANLTLQDVEGSYEESPSL